jgi:hypothetical protein
MILVLLTKICLPDLINVYVNTVLYLKICVVFLLCSFIMNILIKYFLFRKCTAYCSKPSISIVLVSYFVLIDNFFVVP